MNIYLISTCVCFFSGHIRMLTREKRNNGVSSLSGNSPSRHCSAHTPFLRAVLAVGSSVPVAHTLSALLSEHGGSETCACVETADCFSPAWEPMNDVRKGIGQDGTSFSFQLVSTFTHWVSLYVCMCQCVCFWGGEFVSIVSVFKKILTGANAQHSEEWTGTSPIGYEASVFMQRLSLSCFWQGSLLKLWIRQ